MLDSRKEDQPGEKNVEQGMSEGKGPETGPSIELLGIGSSKHRQLKANLQKALNELSLDIPVQEITDIDELMR